jgi:hypothetical protein
MYQKQKTVLDLDQRVDLVHEMQRLLYRDAPYIMLWYDNDLQAYTNNSLTGADIHITAGDLTLSYEYDQPWCPIGPGNTFGTYPDGVPGTDGRDWSTQMFILGWSDGQPTDWSFILSTPPGVPGGSGPARSTTSDLGKRPCAARSGRYVQWA